jgi:zinc protease
MMRTSLLILLCALVFSASVAHAQIGAGVFPNAPRIERLSNGLTVITLPWDSPGIIAYYTLVRVGSRDEVEPNHSGYAHLFEHMMFRGTERYPQERYEEVLQGFGADNNAYTTEDFTLFTVTSPAAGLDRIVELEADRFQHLSYSEDAYRTETGAVRGEYDTSVSNPLVRMEEALREISFHQHTYGHTTLGYLRDIDRMPQEFTYSRSFFRRYYTPDDCTIIAVGDIDHAHLMTLVRAQYGSWRARRDQPRIPVEPQPTQGARRDIDWPAPSAPRMLVAYRIPAFTTGGSAREQQASLRTSAALQVVHGLVFSEPSPLYQRLVVNERALLEFGSWDGQFNRDPTLFVAHATFAEGRTFDPILSAIQGELDGLAQGRVDAERVEAVKSHQRYEMLVDLQTPADVADLMAHFIAVGGRVEMLDSYLAALAAVTPEDVARVARSYLTESHRFIVTLSHGGGR